MRTFEVGRRVRLSVPVIKYPLGIFKAGEVGTVSHNDGVLIMVKLDQHHGLLDAWDNQLHFDAYAAAHCEEYAATDYLEPVDLTDEEVDVFLRGYVADGDAPARLERIRAIYERLVNDAKTRVAGSPQTGD